MVHKRKGSAGRFLSVLLVLLMVLSLAPAGGPVLTVRAEEAAVDSEPAQDENAVTESYIPDADSLPDNEELFAGYVDRTLYGGNEISLFGNYGADSLDGNNLFIYNELKAKIAQVANGTLTSTKFTIDITGKGITDFDSISTSEIIDTLLVDCPYELYWYDKTVGVRFGLSGSQLTVKFSVAVSYADPAVAETVDSKTYYYGTDAAKTGAAAKAARNAQAIVDANANKSDYEKLTAYKKAICDAVSYNTDAAATDYSGGYGDPWQLIYVFDSDESTNVVCEGYSKAFQYLCDLSVFSGNVTCYTVTGSMNGGGHMWNVVSIEGVSYLVDVTNSDTRTVGADGSLFLAGAPGGTENGYTIGRVTYVYDSDTKSLYNSSILTLSASDYQPEADGGVTGAALAGYSLSLSGNIGVNFYMELSDAAAVDGAYMQFSLPGVNHTETKVKIADAKEVTVADKAYYVFSCGVAAKDMTGEIKAQFVNSDGTKSPEYTYTVKQYADYIISHETNYGIGAVDMVKALLNYGGYAQNYFGYNTENLANAGLELALPEKVQLEGYEDKETGSIDGLTYEGSSLMLTTETGIRHYFKVAGNITDYTFTCNGASLTPVQKGDYYYVEIQNISAAKLADRHTLSVNKGSSTYTISYGVYSYIQKVLTGEFDDSLQNVTKALYNYGEAAKAYSASASLN